MSNLIDFSQLGGYRLEQPTFEKMQATYYLFLKAMIGHFGIADTGKFIISGCQVVGGNITPGIVYIDGILCEFAGAAGTLATKIKRLETLQNLEFFNGTTPVVFRKYTAVVDASGTALSAFVRVPSPFYLPSDVVQDAAYVHTDNNFTNELLELLISVEFGAEKNEQADWNTTNSALDSYIKNKPFILNVLRVSSFVVDEIHGYEEFVVNFPSVGTAEYYVLACPTATPGGSSANSTTFYWSVSGKTSTSFQINTREINSSSQQVTFDYIIIGQ